MSNCSQWTELLSAYLDGELDASARAEVEAHLADCSACGALLDEWRAMDAAMGAWETDAPDTLVPAVLREIRRRPPLAHWRRLAGMAAVFAVVVVGVWSARTHVPGGTAGFMPLPSVMLAQVEVTESGAANDEEVTAVNDDVFSDAGAVQFAAPEAPTPPEQAQAADTPVSSDDARKVADANTFAFSIDVAGAEEPAAGQGDAQDGILYLPEPTDLPAQTASDAPLTGGILFSSGEPGQETPAAAPVTPPAPAEAPEAEMTLTDPATASQMRTFATTAPAALTAAEAEGVLNAYLGGEAELRYVGTLENGAYHRFDSADGEIYAVLAADGQVLQKSAPESVLIADWDAIDAS